VTGFRRSLVAAVVLLLGAAPAAAADGTVPSHRLFTFQGHDVYESSGLVDRGDVVWTNNDSGDAAVVYGVDARTGRTVEKTEYAGSVSDVEAIAPGSHGTIWAGDIGDNQARRDDVAVYRVTPGHDGDAPAYPLVYPDRPHNAEALLVQPRTQRVFVVTKSVFGGTVFVAPAHLREGHDNRLRQFARVAGLVTDGTFFPDGRHVLLRTYGTASVYTFPAFELVGTVTLPAQPQGEGISVSDDGRVLVSSEGVESDVLQVDLPAALTQPVRSPVASPSGPAPDTKGPAPTSQTASPPRTAGDWVITAVVGLVIAGLGWLTLRGSRPRSPRKQ
jgi:hypothetical protein